MISPVGGVNAAQALVQVDRDAAGTLSHAEVTRSETEAGKYNEVSGGLLVRAVFPSEYVSSSDAMTVSNVERDRRKSMVYLRVQISSLRQDPDSVAVVTSHLRRSGVGVSTSFTSVNNTLRDIILDADRERRGGKGNPLIVRTSLDAVGDMGRLRVVLVCMDKSIATDDKTLEIFRKAVGAGCGVIAVITPDYEFSLAMINGRTTDTPDWARWWPREMPEMKDFCLFVNLQKRAQWRHKVRSELLPAIDTCLDRWRGSRPEGYPGIPPAKGIICGQCANEMLSKPHVFSRKVVLACVSAGVRGSGAESRCVCMHLCVWCCAYHAQVTEMYADMHVHIHTLLHF